VAVINPITGFPANQGFHILHLASQKRLEAGEDFLLPKLSVPSSSHDQVFCFNQQHHVVMSPYCGKALEVQGSILQLWEPHRGPGQQLIYRYDASRRSGGGGGGGGGKIIHPSSGQALAAVVTPTSDGEGGGEEEESSTADVTMVPYQQGDLWAITEIPTSPTSTGK